MHKAYLMNIEDLPEEEAFPIVPSWRREKAERLRFAKDKKLSLGAWLLLMYAMKKEGLSCGEVAFTERGKPYFTDSALPRFCLSHAGSYALCAIADEEVGCDVQDAVAPSPRLIDRVCTPREKALFSASPQGKLSSESETDEVPVPTSSAPDGAPSPQGEGQTVLPLEGKLSAKPTDEVSVSSSAASERHLPTKERQEDLFASLWAKKESLVKLSGAGMAADFASLETPDDPCFFIDHHAVYACTKNGGFPQETAVVGVGEVLAFLRT